MLLRKIYPRRLFIWTLVIIAVIGSRILFEIEKDKIELHTICIQESLQSVKSDTKSTDTSNWKTYRSEKYGIEFMYPQFEPLKNVEETGDILGTSFHLGLTTQLFISKTDLSLIDWFKKNIDDKNLNLTKANTYKLINYNGIPMLELDGQVPVEYEGFLGSEFIRKIDNKIVLISSGQDSDLWEQGYDSNEKISELLKIIVLSVKSINHDLSLLHSSCKSANKCPSPMQCVSYYGIAGPQIPAFQSCEIPCKTNSDCPNFLTCNTITDGPGQVCTK